MNSFPNFWWNKRENRGPIFVIYSWSMKVQVSSKSGIVRSRYSFPRKKISKMLISPLGLFMRFYSCWIFKLESWKDNLVIAHFMKVISPKEKDQKVFWLRPYAQNTNTCSMNVQSNSASVIWFTLYQIKGNEKKKVENIKKLKTIVKGRRNFT